MEIQKKANKKAKKKLYKYKIWTASHNFLGNDNPKNCCHGLI